MEPQIPVQIEPDDRRANRPWLLVVLFALLLFGCLALVTANAGSGFIVDGQEAHFRLVSAVTNYPFCPPDVPCPISVILEKNHWVVWVLRETQKPNGVETTFRKLIDLPLLR